MQLLVMQLLLQRCLTAGREIGLRVAEPGEFTRRAFLND
jgi:tRNA modification GTPase